MKRIYKFPLALRNAVTIDIHEGAEFLCVQAQNNVPTIWALVDPTRPTRQMTFYVVPTGAEASDQFWDEHEYLGTVQVYIFVYHVFARWASRSSHGR